MFTKAKNDGYNMVQTYFFHNAHQPKLGDWPWIQTGPANLRLFLEKAAKAGFFVDLRIGPYVCAEWSWGGYPYDIAQVPGLSSRSSNKAWEQYMTAVVMNVTREYRDLFADKGGPIVLGQVCEIEIETPPAAPRAPAPAVFLHLPPRGCQCTAKGVRHTVLSVPPL